MHDRRLNDECLERIQQLEADYAWHQSAQTALSNAIALNTKITSEGLAQINVRLAEQNEMFEHYKAAKVGGIILTKLSALVIAIGGAWAVIKGYK